MSRLFILGNGFDLAHNKNQNNFLELDTRECCYIKYLNENKNNYKFWYQTLIDSQIVKIRNSDNISCNLNTKLWGELEASITINNCWQIYNVDNSTDNYANITQINKQKQLSIYDWLHEEYNPNRILKRIKKFNNDDWFITFNYTTLLEDIYRIKNYQILHIHGDIQDKTKIQFGNDQGMLGLNNDDKKLKIFGKDSNSNLENVKSFVRAIKDLTEVHIFGWNGAIKHDGGYYGSDITIFNYLHEILTLSLLPRKKIYIYHHPNIEDSKNGFNSGVWRNNQYILNCNANVFFDNDMDLHTN